MLIVDLDANSRIDFNCRIEHKEMGEEQTLGKYGYGNRNARDNLFIEFCMKYNLKIINTYYKLCQGRRWT